MQKWKYKCDVHYFRIDEGRTNDDIYAIIKELNGYGEKGWELVTLVPHNQNLLDGVLQPQRKIRFDSYWKQLIENDEERQNHTDERVNS